MTLGLDLLDHSFTSMVKSPNLITPSLITSEPNVALNTYGKVSKKYTFESNAMSSTIIIQT